MINRCSSTLGESESRKLGKALAGYVTKKKREKKVKFTFSSSN